MNIKAKGLSRNKHHHLKVRGGPEGLHFFNRKSGLNILVEEFRVPARLWSSAPRQVSIALTNACDLTCPHCYAPKSKAVLDFEFLKRWLIDLDVHGCLGIGFGGGEPTLYPRLVELCSFAARNTKLAVTLTTHAHGLSDQLLDELAGNLHFVRISMDGIGHTYESIRCRPFDKLVNGIIRLKEISPFGINFLVNSKTINDLDAAVQLGEELGASEFLLLPEEPVRSKGGIDNDTSMRLRAWAAHYHGPIPLSVSEGSSAGLPTCNPFSAEADLSAFAHIDAYGALKRTSFDTCGVEILDDGVMEALDKLKLIRQEVIQ